MLPKGLPEPTDCCSWSSVRLKTADVCLDSVVCRWRVPILAGWILAMMGRWQAEEAGQLDKPYGVCTLSLPRNPSLMWEQDEGEMISPP